MNCNWSVKKLGDLVKFTSGGTPSKNIEAYWGGDIPWISASSMDSTRYSESDLKVTSEGAQNGTRLVPKDTVLLLVRGGALHNKIPVGITTREVTFNQDVKALVPITGEITPWYLLFWLISIKKTLLAKVENTGIGAGKLDTKILQELEVPLPPQAELKRLEKFCKALDDKIILNTLSNQTLEAMAQAIFKSWFVDFDPVKAKMNGKQPEGMDEATASLFPDKLVESELGLIPEGWEAKPLGDYLTIKRGGSPRPIQDFIVPEGYPWTKIADATANDNPYIFKTKEFIKEEGLKKTVYLKKGTLILSNSATPGLPRFLELDACIHDGWLHFPEKKHFTDSYLYQLFLHIRTHLIAQGNGSVFTNLKTDILRNQVVLVPPKELVDIYEKHAAKLLEAVKAKSIESNQLAQLRDTLLPKLLSGEIELANTEDMAEVS
jgi:type I restriction enzyme S subunit